LRPGGFSFLSRLADGATLSSAVEAGSVEVADFDVTANLAVLFDAKAVVGVSTAASDCPRYPDCVLGHAPAADRSVK
jgi:hypothetical protein